MNVTMESGRGRTGKEARAVATQTQMAGKSPNPFSKVGSAIEQEVRKEIVVKSPTLRKLLEVFMDPEYRNETRWIDDPINEKYSFVEARIKGMRYTQADIQDFLTALLEYQDDQSFRVGAGLLVSALVNNGPSDGYELRILHLEKRIDFLGFRNVKNLTIIGNVGDCAGSRSESGTLIIDGTAGSYLGNCCKGGTIILNGNAGAYVARMAGPANITIMGSVDDNLGWNLKGATVIVEGDAKYDVGRGMETGSILVKGNAIAAASWMVGGRIVVEGNAMDVGYGMQGGELDVLGNVTGKVGNLSAGGVIRIHGCLEPIRNEIGKCWIFHKGKLIWPRLD